MYKPHVAYSFIRQQTLGLFPPVVNDAPMNMGVRISLGDPATDSFVYVFGGGTAGSYGLIF